ncbi:MAG: TonB-dependent receptor, partial [Sporichthyaceae bacterium]|nr:TonB-dependent receptor [Sporichthyaceae bacterium]
VELIYQQRLGARALWTVSAFNYRVSGLIDPTPVDSSSMIQFRNVSDAVASGLEFGLDLRLGHQVTGYVNYTYQRALDEATRERLTNSPDHLAKAGIGLSLAPGVRVAAESRYASGRRTVQNTTTDPFGVVNLNRSFAPRLSTSSTMGRGLSRLDLAVKVSNLFDAGYATPGGLEHRQSAIVQDGRNLLAELRFRF